ncbi:hypothetical protein F4808DRAFT_462755 [Astrocystis sublimbata]|nr:hypothetical protein F4808DRAFT_462755 [Astrocystis sublimbata]
MLQTWNLKNLNETHQQQVFDPETARPVAQQACDSCRIKKLRCSGQKSGCSRCRTLLQECVYAEPGTRGRGRKRKTSTVAAANDGDKSTQQWASAAAATDAVQSHETTGAHLGSHGRSEPPTPGLITPLSHSHLDSTMAGIPGVDATPLMDRDADSVSSTKMSGPLTPQAVSGGSTLIHDPLSSLDMRQTADFWEFDALNHGPLTPMLPTTIGNDSLLPKYDDLELPYTPNSILSALQYSTFGSHPSLQASEPLRVSADQHHHSDQQQPRSCQCLQRVVLLLEELDCIHDESGVQEPGAWLSRLKEALRCGDALLLCAKCQAKPENISILGFLIDRLTTMCGLIVNRFVEILRSSQSHGVMGATDAAWRFSLGDFEIGCVGEWDVLVRAMLMMQLRALDGLINRLRSVSGDVGHRKMCVAQRRILDLLNKIAQPLAE